MALSPFTLVIGTKSDALNGFNVIPNAPYEIRLRNTNGSSGALANIFSDSAGLVPITQTGATVDSRGSVTFYASAIPLNAQYNNGSVIVQPIDIGVTNQNLISFGRVIPFPTLAAAIQETNQAKIFDGAALNINERTSGNGGGAIWDVVLTSSVTPNSYDIQVSAANPDLSLVLRDGQQFGNQRLYRSNNGAHSYIRQDPNAWSDDVATRFYIEPTADAIAAGGTGGALKIFSVPFSDGGPFYQDFGLYYSRDQDGDEGYYEKGVFYINSKAVGVNNPDIAITFQDGLYYASKATLLPADSEGGNRAVTIFGKRNSTTAKFLDKCVQEISGWIGFDLGSSGLAWWGVLTEFSSKLNVVDSSDFTATDELNWSGNNQNVLQISKERTRIKASGGATILELLNAGLSQGLKVETRVVGRQATVSTGSFSVAGMNSAVLNFAGATTVTALTDGIAGQIITLIAGNANATIQHNATIRLKSGANYVLPSETGVSLCWSGLHSKWFEIATSA